MAEVEAPQTCPNCKQAGVQPTKTGEDGLRFRRCPRCSWSWFTRLKKADGAAPPDKS